MTAGTDIPVVTRTPDAIDLFMFSGVIVAHPPHPLRPPFTTEHDGHPGLLVHGPLQGTYMVQAAQRWLGRERPA